MNKRVLLPMTPQLKQRFLTLHQQLNAGSKEKLAKPLGDVLADLSCEILDRMFSDLLVKVKTQTTNQQELAGVKDSEKVVQQVNETFKKYMPYAVSLFGNERLVPLVNYLQQQIIEKEGKTYLIFFVSDDLLNQTLAQATLVQAGEQSAIPQAFNGLIKIIDKGVDHLIREPKKILKFNFVIDKTLTGVLNMTTSLGYKRLEKLSTQMSTPIAGFYVDHFIGFVEK